MKNHNVIFSLFNIDCGYDMLQVLNHILKCYDNFCVVYDCRRVDVGMIKVT